MRRVDHGEGAVGVAPSSPAGNRTSPTTLIFALFSGPLNPRHCLQGARLTELGVKTQRTLLFTHPGALPFLLAGHCLCPAPQTSSNSTYITSSPTDPLHSPRRLARPAHHEQHQLLPTTPKHRSHPSQLQHAASLRSRRSTALGAPKCPREHAPARADERAAGHARCIRRSYHGNRGGGRGC